MLSDNFDSKSVDLRFSCYPSNNLSTFSFRTSDVRRLLVDLTVMVALTHWVCFLFD